MLLMKHYGCWRDGSSGCLSTNRTVSVSLGKFLPRISTWILKLSIAQSTLIKNGYLAQSLSKFALYYLIPVVQYDRAVLIIPKATCSAYVNARKCWNRGRIERSAPTIMPLIEGVGIKYARFNLDTIGVKVASVSKLDPARNASVSAILIQVEKPTSREGLVETKCEFPRL